jgi:hypothetical protein
MFAVPSSCICWLERHENFMKNIYGGGDGGMAAHSLILHKVVATRSLHVVVY